MLINLAYEGLLEIECDCLQLDGHGVRNLIDTNRARRAKGFLADRFIKPPANITFTFKCNVDISKVILKPRVGAQKSSGFEILKVFRNKTTSTIAHTIINEYCERVEFSKHAVSGEETVRFSSDRAGERVRQMKLKIFKTCGSTVPALGGLEIWGRPSLHVPEKIKNEMTDLWKSIICGSNAQKERTTDAEIASGTISSVSGPSISGCKRLLRHEDIVPDEFIDPISCEIMTIPMTLPSGNIVDLSTLEKFYAAEAKHGRGRGDPFTGVLFTEQNKPVAATSLKTRLDKFLLENCDDPSIKVLPRTLGKNLAAPSRSSCTLSANANQITVSGETSSNHIAGTVDQLLVGCLEGLPSYLTEPPPSKMVKISCTKCSDSSPDVTGSYIFKLPCQHLVCRKCLIIMKGNLNASCGECHRPFGFDSIQRHHVYN